MNNTSMLKQAVEFYNKLLGKEASEGLKLDESFQDDGEKVTPKENQMLEESFTEDEIKSDIDNSYAERAPGPDGFSFMFYQKFWPTIKKDFMAIVKDFEARRANMARLNYARIILVPEEDGAKSLKKFRPISLIN
jgi:elongation factor P--beta-lysine ligase